VIELKILRKSLEATTSEGLIQTADYMDRCGADEGHLVIFDRRPKRKWAEKIFRKQEADRATTEGCPYNPLRTRRAWR